MKQISQKNRPGTSLLAKEFTSLVDWSVTELGQVIKRELGIKGFQRIENIRQYVKSKSTRDLQGLLTLKKNLVALSREEQFQIAHSFALMLELINCCEAAYRSFRLFQEKTSPHQASPDSAGQIIHVLTAHPTESRNSDIIFYFQKIQKLLVNRLENAKNEQTAELHGLLQMAWNLPMSKQRKPSVMDEAEYIYSLALQKEIVDLYVRNERAKLPVYIRTWVGGDKDGNPSVNEKTMIGSLAMSRGFLLKWLLQEFRNYIEDLTPLARSGLHNKKQIQSLLVQAKQVKLALSKIKTIRKNDSRRVHEVKEFLNLLHKTHRHLLDSESEHLIRIRTLFRIFPALVVPLELREDSGLVHEALTKPVKAMNISRMLQTLAQLCPDHNPRSYVRGFILSQCESVDDLEAGVKLVQKFCSARLPVVPLFESAHSLQSSTKIIEDFIANKTYHRIIKKFWSSQLEVMLGYSDSAKENGSFPSRFLIQSALVDLEKKIQEHGLIPIFFHGSGGSVERGGGSVQEQTEWWPASALDTVKMTVQGEMVYRNYTSPLILQRQLNVLVQNRLERHQTPAALDPTKSSTKRSTKIQILLQDLAKHIQHSYQNSLQDPRFLELIEKATPYSFLKDLKLGSRPSKRQGPVSLKKLRAIPWVLCWTQTRILFPTWWGIGSFWKTLNPKKKKEYKKLFTESAMFRSYIKALGFTLKKIEMEIFFLYLRSSKLDSAIVLFYENLFKQEYAEALKSVREITGEKSLLWYRPWLETSIELRSPLIHPINVLQLIALETKDIKLLRETVTGIANGMLTTG